MMLPTQTKVTNSNMNLKITNVDFFPSQLFWRFGRWMHYLVVYTDQNNLKVSLSAFIL